MPVYQRGLDVYQGFNYKKDRQTPFGYITSMTIGGIALDQDLTYYDPTKALPADTGTATVGATNTSTDVAGAILGVGVLSNVLWETGVTDALYFSGQLSPVNRQLVAALLINSLLSVEIVFSFGVFDYDPVNNVYFLAFSGAGASTTMLYGLLEKNGDELNLSVSNDPATEVQSPINYAFQIGIKPEPSAQAIQIATAFQSTIVKTWGMSVKSAMPATT